MLLPFEDDDSVYCDICDCEITAGENYYVHPNGTLCCSDEDCMKELLFREHENELSQGYIRTGYDKEIECGDMEYHRMKEEGEID